MFIPHPQEKDCSNRYAYAIWNLSKENFFLSKKIVASLYSHFIIDAICLFPDNSIVRLFVPEPLCRCDM